jgi:hypothetical protein
VLINVSPKQGPRPSKRGVINTRVRGEATFFAASYVTDLINIISDWFN